MIPRETIKGKPGDILLLVEGPLFSVRTVERVDASDVDRVAINHSIGQIAHGGFQSDCHFGTGYQRHLRMTNVVIRAVG